MLSVGGNREKGGKLVFSLTFLSFSLFFSHFLVVLLFHFLSPRRYFLSFFPHFVFYQYYQDSLLLSLAFCLPHIPDLSLSFTHTHTHTHIHTHTHTHTMLMNLCQEKVGARPAHCPSPPPSSPLPPLLPLPLLPPPPPLLPPPPPPASLSFPPLLLAQFPQG